MSMMELKIPESTHVNQAVDLDDSDIQPSIDELMGLVDHEG
jgi:hypothetical protein